MKFVETLATERQLVMQVSEVGRRRPVSQGLPASPTSWNGLGTGAAHRRPRRRFTTRSMWSRSSSSGGSQSPSDSS